MFSLDIVIPAYDAGKVLGETLDAIFRQARPPGLSLGVIVVDSGSRDDTAAVASAREDDGVRLVVADLPGNRAAARNTGVAASAADYVLLLDADCRLVGDQCFEVVASAIGDGIAAGFGYTTGRSDSALGRYLAALERRRTAAGWLGWTTACCLIRREIFDAVGGYSTAYTHYGFEDRDFICRLRSQTDVGEFRSLRDLRATHDAAQVLADISGKMYESGRYSSGIFMSRFPEAYEETDYGRIDAALASWPVAAALYLASLLEPAITASAERVLRWPGLPAGIGRGVIRFVSAASYFRGTRDRSRQETPGI